MTFTCSPTNPPVYSEEQASLCEQAISSFIKGARILVTGSSSGIGAGIAKQLGCMGARVIVNYNSDLAGANVVVDAITESGGEAFAVKGNVAKPEDVQTLVDAAVEHFGGLDHVIANAGIQVDAPSLEMTIDQWNKVISVNLTGAFLTAQTAAKQFIKQRESSDDPSSYPANNVVFIGSVHQHIPWAGHVNYAATKGGMQIMMESLAQEWSHYRIRLNAIAPGAIKTPINKDVWGDPEKKKPC